MSYTQQRIDLDISGQLNTLPSNSASTDGSPSGSTTLTANVVYYAKIDAPSDGFLNVIRMGLPSALTGKCKAALYADNGSGTSPTGSALEVSTELTNPAVGTAAFVFSNTLAIVGGTTYWVAFQTNTSHGWLANSVHPANSQGTQSTTYSTFPSANIGGTLGQNFFYVEIIITPTASRSNAFPLSFRYALMSAWFEPTAQSGFLFWGGQDTTGILGNEQYGITVVYNSSADPFGPGYGLIEVVLYDGASPSPILADVIFPAPDDLTNALTNIVISVDSVGQVMQCLFNGALATPLSATWNRAAPIQSGGVLLVTEIEERDYGLGRAEFCVGDIYVATPAAFFDLSSRSNSFISGGLPVDLGNTGLNPTGTAPIAYYSVRSGGTANDFCINLGSGGGNLFNPGGDQVLCITPEPFVVGEQYAMPLTPVPLTYKDKFVVLDTEWTTSGEICLLQTYPMPVTVTATIPELEVGDTPSQ